MGRGIKTQKEVETKAKGLLRAGYTIKETARHCKISEATVSRIKQETPDIENKYKKNWPPELISQMDYLHERYGRKEV